MSSQIHAQVKHPSAQAPSFIPTNKGFVQRKCADDECRKKKLTLQRYSDNAEPSVVPPIVHEVLRSSGQPLDPAPRAFMEPRFGHDFSKVRVHTDAKAAESARAVNARAYTVGRDVVFGKGKYVPHTASGQRLLAHELTHAVQQEKAFSFGSTNLHLAAEGEANAAAEHLISGVRQIFVQQWPILPILQKEDGNILISPLTIPKEGIDMPWVGKGAPASELGYLRDSNYYWKEYAKKWPEQLSPKNMQRIGKELPMVDDIWIKYHPEHAAYNGQRLEHHHLGQGSRAVPLPEKLHDAYTVFHPQRQVVGQGNEPLKPLKPRPTAERTEKEIARHVKEGRIRGGEISAKKPPHPPKVPVSSEIAGVQPEKLRPVDPVTGKVIKGISSETPATTPPVGTQAAPVRGTPGAAPEGPISGTTEAPPVQSRFSPGSAAPESAAAARTGTAPEGATTPKGGAGGTVTGVLSLGLPLIYNLWIHPSAVQQRVQEEGYVPVGPSQFAKEGLLGLLGGWLLDPTLETAQPLSSRWNVPVWRKHLREHAAKIPIGGILHYTAQFQHTDFGITNTDDYDIEYVRQSDSSFQARPPSEKLPFPIPDINRILDPDVSDDAVKRMLTYNPYMELL